MSIEVGNMIRPVFIRGEGTKAIRARHIDELRSEVLETEPEFTGLLSALDVHLQDTNRDGDSIGTFNKMINSGQYLIGVDEGYAYGYTLAGLLYAEGEAIAEDDSFSVIRMGTWMSTKRITDLKEREQMRSSLISASLRIMTDGVARRSHWNIPVNRLTAILPFTSSDPEPYIYGHKVEQKQINDLEVPLDLRELLSRMTEGYHSGELTERQQIGTKRGLFNSLGEVLAAAKI